MSVPGSGSPWYRGGLEFTCRRCGNCCSGAPGYVWVTAAEIETIAAALGVSPGDFESRHTRRVGKYSSLCELPNGDCEFLERRPDGTTACRIHRCRPMQCAGWPFWGPNLESRESWDAAAKNCPGINQGEHYPLPVIQAALRANASRPL